jgi:hypothetical protein
MDQSNSSQLPTRAILKLKPGAKRTSAETKTSPTPGAPSKAIQKPGASWSDDYKRSMQEEMDALATR